MKKFAIISVIFLAVLVFVIASNRQATPKSDNHQLTVTTSFYPFYFFSREIGRDKVSITNITPVGVEPHDYEPSIQNIVSIEKSDLLIIDGILEPWGKRQKENLKGSSVTVLEVRSESNVDPHTWLNPVLAKTDVAVILAAFSRLDPENSSYYQQNANQLLAKLSQLDSDYRSGLANCRQQSIVTSHDAFGHLASEYGFKQIAISGLSPDEEPSSKDLVRIATFSKQNNIKHIFFESLVSPKLSQTLAFEIGASVLVLDPLEGPSSDNIKLNYDYFTIMRNNLNNLKIALECTQ